MKSVYKEIVIELSKVHSMSQLITLHNKMITLSREIDDEELNQLVAAFINPLLEASHFYKLGSIHNAHSVINSNLQNRQLLLNYCTNMMSNEIPDWQIEAQKHGWRPPIGG